MLIRLTALSTLIVLGLPATGAVRSASAGAAPQVAPSDLSAQQRRRPPTRVLIVPLSRYHRECVDWYRLEHRPSGDVVTPQMSCRWVAR